MGKEIQSFRFLYYAGADPWCSNYRIKCGNRCFQRNQGQRSGYFKYWCYTERFFNLRLWHRRQSDCKARINRFKPYPGYRGHDTWAAFKSLRCNRGWAILWAQRYWYPGYYPCCLRRNHNSWFFTGCFYYYPAALKEQRILRMDRRNIFAECKT